MPSLRADPQEWLSPQHQLFRGSGQGLKTGQGIQDWRRFFTLMGTYVAVTDGTAAVENTPTSDELIAELRMLAEKLQVINRLTAYREAVEAHIAPGAPLDAKYYVLSLDAAGDEPQVTVFAFTKDEVAEAEQQERMLIKAKSLDVVLVSVDSIASLRRAYPNYFLDTRLFLDLVREAIA